MDESAKFVDLRAENARLIAILETHGIALKKPVDPVWIQLPSKESEPSKLSMDEKTQGWRVNERAIYLIPMSYNYITI